MLAWVLPATPHSRDQFRWLATEIDELGGETTLWESKLVDGDGDRLIAQFTADRPRIKLELASDPNVVQKALQLHVAGTTADLVDWARSAGFNVVSAGRGHKWLPHFAQSTPETVWGHYGLTEDQARIGGLNPNPMGIDFFSSGDVVTANGKTYLTATTTADDAGSGDFLIEIV